MTGTEGELLEVADGISYNDINKDGYWTPKSTTIDVRVIGGGTSTGENAAPTTPSVTVTPSEPYAEDMLFCTASGTTDPDGDAWSYYYQWYAILVDGTSGFVTDATQPVLDESLTTAGDRWFCEVYAEDVYGNRSETVRTSSVTIRSAVTGTQAYEPNDTMATAHRILPHLDPTDIDDANGQEHVFEDSDDQDWFWFIVEDGAGYQSSRVIFETNNGVTMYDDTHNMSDDTGTNTQLWLYDSEGTRLAYVVDYGNLIGAGGTRYARFDMELTPGIYYVRVQSEISVSLTSGVNDTYDAHLIIEPAAGATGPSAPTVATLSPTSPNTSENLVVEASGAVSSLGESAIEYWYVWFRDGEPVPFGGGAQYYEGSNYLLANRKPAIDEDGLPANVVSSKYTKAGEVWQAVVYAADANGESTAIMTNTVTISDARWEHVIRVAKTFNDGTATVSGDDQTVTLGWLFGATHGFDEGTDAELPSSVPASGTPGGTSDGTGALPAGRAYSMGFDPSHSMLSEDYRPYGDMTSWYVKVELGSDPATCRLSWDDVSLPVDDTPLTITRVTQDAYGNFHSVYGSTVDMTEDNEIIVSEDLIESLVEEVGQNDESETEIAVIYRVSLGAGDTSFTLTLDPGWNLVSLPLQPTQSDVDRVFRYNGQQVYSGTVWAYDNGTYVAATSVEPLTGYWVYCPFSESVDVTVYGMRVATAIELKAGWNLVGVSESLDRESTYGAYGSAGLNVVDVDAISEYDPSTGVYTVPTTMEPGKAYWIKATEPVDLPSVSTP